LITHAHREHPELSIRRLCELFGVGRTWYYTHASPEEIASRDVALRDAIECIVLEFPGYGYRRVTKALQREGWTVNHKRVLRVMRQESLLCQLKRRFVTTTDACHGRPVYPNLIRELRVSHLDQVWVADITYIRLPTTFAYLACILDACSRRCIGWCLSRSIDTRLTLTALEIAFANRQPQSGLIHHSDRGVQYASGDYVERLERTGTQISMAAAGNPYENAQIESFFRTLKREEVSLHDYRTFAEAEANIEKFIETVYNQKRLHSSLGYLPPVEFEAAYAAADGC